MHSTKAARSLKNLFAGYHEPPSLSKQQSQKLLDGLKSSFRDNLDREYGRGPANNATAASEMVATKQATPTVERNQAYRRPAAKQHLKDLLSNPLFSYQTKPVADAPLAATSLKREPMDVFDHAVSKGMLTIRAATGCLIAERQRLQALGGGKNRRPSDANVTPRVVGWLSWFYPNGDLGFLDDKSFIQALMPFLISEKSEHLVWEWMSRTVKTTTLNNEVRLQRASCLLSGLVKHQSQPQYGNLDAAITSLLKAERLFASDALLPELLIQPWRSISWLSTVESYSRKAASEELFDAHMAAADRLVHPVDAEKAHLHLYHPTHPDHNPAMQFFQDTDKLRSLIDGLSPAKLSSAKSKGMGVIPWVAVLGHDTVNYLLKSGRSQEAEGINELLQSELSVLFSPTPKVA
ncbi:hypothetical protein N3K66_001399 [Trichothecium roseum]|uniref:Uncharacterized protein n=1 Tax=Trichothecium roseum TaxID=47278 RepID=A0ACC0VEL0_9HYPO|nr:hypothetical protein N3K66_001399 [Trichothecium roseum]